MSYNIMEYNVVQYDSNVADAREHMERTVYSMVHLKGGF